MIGKTYKTTMPGRLTCESRHDHGPVRVGLRWDPSAPLEVSIWVDSSEFNTIKLVTLRDTLVDAYANGVDQNYVFGIPGIVTWKARLGAETSQQVIMRVYNEIFQNGYGDIVTLRPLAQTFIHKTLLALPLGQECTEADIDRALALIMGS